MSGMRCKRHMARMGVERNSYRQIDFWWGKQMDGGHTEDPGLDSKIILKLMLQKNLTQNRYKSEGCSGHVY